MKVGDIVRKHGESILMTVEEIKVTPHNTFIHVVWFDENEKCRRLRFFQPDLIIVAHSAHSGGMGLK